MLVRLALMAGLVLLAPVMFLLGRRAGRATGLDVLQKEAARIWEPSPSDAIALLRKTYDQLTAKDGFARLKTVSIPPFGDFAPYHTMALQQYIWRCEMAVGNYEGALALAASLGRIEFAILQQVDCLVAMGRKADAIALLESSFDLDGWRRTLRRRWVELGGRPLRVVN
jgi:hypothetical protein